MAWLLRPPWPLPALLAWGGALLLASMVAVAASVLGSTWWRRGLIAAGFPLALAFTGLAAVPAWAWLVPLLLLLAVYPLNAWRDAPLFPPPHAALQGRPPRLPRARGARVLDGGCGRGDALLALRRTPHQAR